jgi:hypothetical protein
MRLSQPFAILLAGLAIAAALLLSGRRARYQLVGGADLEYVARLDTRTGDVTLCILRREGPDGAARVVYRCDGKPR